MNIGQLAEQAGVSTDTLRFYEKQGLVDAPARHANGYRSYGDADLARVRFVRSAQSLGFSLTEIRQLLPQLASGQLSRGLIEQHLIAKMAEIDAHMARLRALKRELKNTFDSLRCEPDTPVSVAGATAKQVVPKAKAKLPARAARAAR